MYVAFKMEFLICFYSDFSFLFFSQISLIKLFFFFHEPGKAEVLFRAYMQIILNLLEFEKLYFEHFGS